MTQQADPALAPTSERSGRGLVRGVLDVVGVLVAFAAAGLGAGWFWEDHAPRVSGVVVSGTWYGGTRIQGDLVSDNFPDLQHYFDATARFVIIGVLVALVLGTVAALVTRTSEVVILLTVAAGSVLACYVAYHWGVHLGPSSPVALASGAADGTVLEADLAIKGGSPFVSWTFGAILGLGVTYFVTAGITESRRREDEDSSWLSRNQIG